MNGLLTVREAAEILRVHKHTVYEYLIKGKLKAHRIVGNRWRIKSDDFEAFLNSGEVKIKDKGE